MNRKTCRSCGRVCKAQDFYTNHRNKDGLSSYCRKCANAKSTAWQKAHPGRTRELQARWKARNRSKVRANNVKHRQAYRRRHPEKYAAEKAINRAVRSGRLVRPDRCTLCHTRCKPHGHHDDYSKPLDVIWVCHTCHVWLHQKQRHEEAA